MNAYCAGAAVIAFRHDAQGRVVRRSFPAEHACFIRQADAREATLRLLRGSEHVLGIREEGEWVRVVWTSKEVLKRVSAKDGYFAQLGIDTFEGDLDPVRRWHLDQRVLIQRPRRCFLDFEADSRVTFRELHRMRILCWSLSDESGRTVARGMLEDDTDAAERVMLQGLVKALDAFVQVIAWNGDRFDFPLFYERARRLGINAEWQRWLWLDHMVLWLRMNMSASESGDEKQFAGLGAIAEAVLGEKKQVDLSEGTHISWKMWRAGGEERRRLGLYCDDDATKMARIEARTGYIELHHTLCDVMGVFPDSRAVSPKVQVESYLMRLGHGRGMRFATAHYRDNVAGEGDQFKGAYVMHPTQKGIVKGVHVCDFARLYPSIIVSWNMSPETLTDDRLVENVDSRPSYLRHLPLKRFPLPEGTCFAPITNAVFSKATTGLLPEAVLEMLRLRKEWDDKKSAEPPGTALWKEADRRSAAYKIAANIFFGVVGSQFSRFYVRALGESITQAGSFLIKAVAAAAEERGLRAIYGDTDSLFIVGCSRETFEAFVAWCNKELFPKLVAEHSAPRNEIKLAYEKEFERVVMVSAKRYIGRYTHYKGKAATEKSKPEIKGLEYKRGDGARMGRQLQGEVIDALLGGGVLRDREGPCEEDPHAFVALLDRWRARVLEGELARDEVILSKKLGKALDEYERKKKKDGTDAALPAHVEVAHILLKRGRDIGSGVRIEYVVTDGAASPQVTIPAEDWTPGAPFDRYYLWEDLVFPPTRDLLEAAFPGEDWSRWAKVRPPKPRSHAQKLEAAGQGTLITSAVVAGKFAGQPLVKVQKVAPKPKAPPPPNGQRKLF